MKRGSRFLIGFAAAALTFGSLMAGLGKDRFAKHCQSNRYHHGCYHHHHCDEEGDYEPTQPNQATPNK